MCRRSWIAALLGLFFVPRAEGAVYHRGHNCPACGRVVVNVHAFRPDGRHYHRCGRTLWYH